jgi:hypothetical protein
MTKNPRIICGADAARPSRRHDAAGDRGPAPGAVGGRRGHAAQRRRCCATTAAAHACWRRISITRRLPRNRSSRCWPPASRWRWWWTPAPRRLRSGCAAGGEGARRRSIASSRCRGRARRSSRSRRRSERSAFPVLRLPAEQIRAARRGAARTRHLPYALVFYEAPHRIVEAVAALLAAFGPAADAGAGARTDQAVREHPCLSAGRSADWLLADANRQRGEFVLLVSGAPAVSASAEGGRVLKLLLDDGPAGRARRAGWRTRSPASARRPCIRIGLAPQGLRAQLPSAGAADPARQVRPRINHLEFGFVLAAGSSMQITLTRPDDWHLASARWSGARGRAAA